MPNDDVWLVLRRLAHLNDEREFTGTFILDRKPTLEDCLRRVLRPHDEADFHSAGDEWMVLLRRDLDCALDELTLREIRYELVLERSALPEIARSSLHVLFASDAFLRYLDAYLYFAIRFLAGRPEFAERYAAPCADSNSRLLPLTFPPELPLPVAGLFFDSLQIHILSDSGDPNIGTALDFLDGFRAISGDGASDGSEEPAQFELWLRGLWPDAKGSQTERFLAISTGLQAWAIDRADFYLGLNRPEAKGAAPAGENVSPQFDSSQGLVIDPVAPRLALRDVYWIARLLCAEVSPESTVRYQEFSWLHLLRFHALYQKDAAQAERIKRAEDALRSVFDFTCDLIQNSIEITRTAQLREAFPDAYPSKHNEAVHWRAVFNEELREIERQRKIRHFRDPSLHDLAGVDVAPEPAGASGRGSSRDVWSDRITSGKRPHNLIGLAFSGGGIRSATLNLGVLQGLQELDLLRHVDYLSTVSGGGFIGSWLVANVRRSAHWLGRLTDWSDSIAHLRAYSNYLAPRTGILSADTWNLANSWFRNAFLIQLTGLAWLFVLLLATIESVQVFRLLANVDVHGVAGAVAAAITLVSIMVNLRGTDASSTARHRSARWIRLTAVLPACIGAYALSARLSMHALRWAGRGKTPADNRYSQILHSGFHYWWFILVASFCAFLLLAASTLTRRKAYAIWIAALCALALYLELSAILYLFRMLVLDHHPTPAFGFVFGPSLVLFSFTISVLLLIGFTGRNTDEAQREWWTRFGTWLGLFAGLGIILSSVTIFGPELIHRVFAKDLGRWWNAIKWASVASWFGSVVAGLFAGKSSKTSEDGNARSPWLQAIAKAGGLLFVLGSFVAGATLLVALLHAMWSADAKEDYVTFVCTLAWWKTLLCLAAVLVLALLFSSFFEINIFGLNQFYRNRLVRCYLGATRWMPGARRPNPFTGFDFRDDLDLSRFCTESAAEGLPVRRGVRAVECGPYRGPLPIVNCTLNLGGSSDLALNTRHSDSFTLTPLRCGSNRPKVGYAPTTSEKGKFADGVRLGQAVAISGAAVSSNMGYNTSPLVAFLLTMFNVRLGWWFPNPAHASWKNRGLNFSFRYLMCELLGVADENRAYLNVSDGGHFENLGIYELIRRRCRLIIACDAECDEFLQFGGLGNLIRICETDFGATIEVDVKSIRPQGESSSLAHCAVGLIKYSSGEIGQLIYLKASITGDEGVSIAQYRGSHPSFPHETTANQFFTEAQFESYRALGLHMVQSSFKGTLSGADPLATVDRLADVLTPAGCPTSDFMAHSATLAGMWEKLRLSPGLHDFMDELLSLTPHPPVPSITTDELCVGLELMQLMEDVFLDLRLEDFWGHPDNRGWTILFMRWARSPRFRCAWDQAHRTFGIRFEYFCNARLGLSRDRPIVRV